MFTKLDNIHKTTKDEFLKKYKPLFSFKTKIIEGGLTREQRMKIADVNKYFIKKLNSQVSCYSRENWNNDYKKAQYFKKNICLYPSIDFHKSSSQGGESKINQISKSVMYDTQKNNFYSTKFKPIKSFSQENLDKNSNNSKINYNSNNSQTKKSSN